MDGYSEIVTYRVEVTRLKSKTDIIEYDSFPYMYGFFFQVLSVIVNKN